MAEGKVAEYEKEREKGPCYCTASYKKWETCSMFPLLVRCIGSSCAVFLDVEYGIDL